MGFGEAIRTCFRKYVTFRGRARRSEYWYFYLFTILGGLAAGILDAIVGGATGATESFRNTTGPFAAILNLALLLPSIAVTVRRLHDRNHSGWVFGGFFIYLAVAVAAFIGILGTVSAPNAQSNPVAVILGIVLILGGVGYAIFILVQLILNGTAGDNRFGTDPKGPNVEVFS